MAEGTSVNKGKPSLIQKTNRFLKDMRGELKKVVWPGKKQIINNTLVVIVMVVCAAIFIGGFDTILTFLIRFFLKGA